MDRKEKLEMLRKLSEADLTKKFLIPLYESDGMGCHNVRYTHKNLEFGKDIVYYKEDEYGNRNYVGIQVKATKITARNIGEVLRQTTEAFGDQFTDLSEGKKRDLDRFVVLTSSEFTDTANQSFRASLRGFNLDRFVTCVDGNQLVGLLEKNLPQALWDEYDYFNKYFNAMRKDFMTIKDISAIGQKEPVPLENIYVSLKLTEEVVEQYIPDEQEWKIFEEKLSEREKQEIDISKERTKVLNAEKAAQEYQKLVIVGAPGSGKTTLLKYLALKLCRKNIERQKRTCVPVPVTLRQLVESGKGLRAYIDDVFEKYKFPKAKDFVEKDLKEGKCKLFLDGFDELATRDNQENIADQIERFIKKYPKAVVLVTSRVAGYHDELKGFVKAELMEFDEGQIEKFISNWFGEENPKRAQSMINAIKKNEQIKALARNPLMIAIIAIIYEEDRKLPQRRVDLYKRCVDVLLSKWDVRKKIRNKYSSEKKEFILRKLAFYGHINNKRILTEDEVIQEILRHIAQIGLTEQDAKPCLDEIWKRSYLLRQISMTSYDFMHLSFQEYFTALELKEGDDGIATIIQHLPYPWWQEPILLYAGISRDASSLIKRIEAKVPEDIFHSNLILFGKCIADADFTGPAMKEKIVDELWSLYQKGEHRTVRNKAIEVLGLIKPDKLTASLIADLSDERTNRGRAASALGRIGNEQVIELLIEALTTDKDSDVRLSASSALGSIGSEQAIEPLIEALTTDKEYHVRGSAAIALGSIGSEQVIDTLIEALTTDTDSSVRGSAASALGRIGSEQAIEPLIEVLTTDTDSDVRGSATDTLGSIGSEQAIETLIEALTTDKDRSVRGKAAYALGCIGSEQAIESLLEELTSDKERHVRGNAAYALGCIGSEQAIEPLIEALTTDKEHHVRGNAAYALGRIVNEQTIEPLIEALTTDKERHVRGSAASALGRIGSEKAIKPLMETLATDEDGSVRESAASALGRIGSEQAIKPLMEALATDEDGSVQRNAASALGWIGGEEAIEPLKQSLADEADHYEVKVKDSAFTALERISKRNGIRITS